jgi:hypothetical protein
MGLTGIAGSNSMGEMAGKRKETGGTALERVERG